MTNISRLFKSTILISIGSLLFCSHLVQADLNIGGKTIFTGTLIEVLAPGPDLPTIIANITDASADKPYLIKLGPGVYDLGTTTLVMKSHVEIRGSGEDVTLIKGDVSAASWSSAALIQGANDATLSHLTVDNVGNTHGLSTAIYNNSTSPTLRHVTLKTYPAGNRPTVHNNGSSASPMIMDSSIIAGSTQTAMYSYNSTAKVINCYLNGSVYTKDSWINISFSYIDTDSTKPTVQNDGSSARTEVFSSTLDGGAVTAINSALLPKCAGVTDENNTFHPSTCP